mmetsp:Transcript_27986/g.34539  ORF Transcript_27986/g.34539 Transcript_27986/m.34539 type:complete len:141 (+) Transcript_27986:137-559(+)
MLLVSRIAVGERNCLRTALRFMIFLTRERSSIKSMNAISEPAMKAELKMRELPGWETMNVGLFVGSFDPRIVVGCFAPSIAGLDAGDVVGTNTGGILVGSIVGVDVGGVDVEGVDVGGVVGEILNCLVGEVEGTSVVLPV